MKKKSISLFLFTVICICCNAQTAGYKFYSKLDSVQISGFYNIELTPEINAHVKTNFSDVRIINAAEKWVPHLLHIPASEKSDGIVLIDLKYSIVENSNNATVVIIESSQNKSANIGLRITNTAAERFCTLNGSDDNKNWFVINDSILLNPVPDEKEISTVFKINYPTNSFKFLKLVIHNKNNNPFDIKGVVTYLNVAEINNPLNKIIANPAAVIQQKDSAKISYITIKQQLPYQFDYISLQLSAVKYFHRTVEVYIPFDKNHSYSNPGQLIQSFIISNNSSLQFKVPLTKAAVFYLLINNEDNLPLTVTEVKTSFNNKYITTYLENAGNYKLIVDNKNAMLPNYDLSNLTAKMPDSILILQSGKLLAINENKPSNTSIKNYNWILWPSIITALLILLFFTFKMMKEVDKNKTA